MSRAATSMPTQQCQPNTRHLTAALLLTLYAIAWPASALAQQTVEIKPEDKKQMGACASLGLKIIQNGQHFDPAFRRLGNNLLFMPAVIEQPLKDDPHFMEGRDSMTETLAAASPSDKNPVYLKAISRCTDWVNQFIQEQPQAPAK